MASLQTALCDAIIFLQTDAVASFALIDWSLVAGVTHAAQRATQVRALPDHSQRLRGDGAGGQPAEPMNWWQKSTDSSIIACSRGAGATAQPCTWLS